MIHYDDQTQRDHHALLRELESWLSPLNPWDKLRLTLALQCTPMAEMEPRWVTAWRRDDQAPLR